MMGICLDCGGALPEGSSGERRFCDECIRKHKREAGRRGAEMRRQQREAEAQKRSVDSLSQLEAEARALGLSYGEYMARRRT